MADPYTLLLAGNIIGAILAVFTNSMGFWFWALMIFAFEIVVYLKTQNITMVAVTGIIIMSVMSALMPASAIQFGILAIILTFAAILWKVFH